MLLGMRKDCTDVTKDHTQSDNRDVARLVRVGEE